RPTCERKSDLEASGLQRAKISFATFCGPRLAHDVDEQARPFEVGVAGSVDEWQMELATALGYFSGDERRHEQRRLGPRFPLCFDQRWGGEPVCRFDLSVEAVLAAFNQQIDDGISTTVLTTWRRVNLRVNSGGLLERLPGSMQDLAFGGCHRRVSPRPVQYLQLYT